MVLITALWRDLNKNLSPDEKAGIEEKRRIVAEKRTAYETLMRECSQQLTKHQPDFEGCYSKFGLPSKNPQSREPFYGLIVSGVGKVSRIDFFTGGTEEVKTCLRKIIEGFTFSGFSHDKTLRLYITQFPDCRVQELDHLLD